MTADVLHVLPDLRIGGGQQVVLDAIKNGDRKSFQYHVAQIVDSDEMGDRFREIGVDPVLVGATNPISTLRRLADLIRRRSIDIVHVHSPLDRKYGHAAAFATRRPVVSHLHSPWDHRGDRIAEGSGPAKVAWKRTKAAVRDSIERRVVSEYIAVSAPVLDFFRSRGLEPLTLIENGIDLTGFASGESARQQAMTLIGARQRVVMSVARLDAGKGHLDLIQCLALSAHDDWELILVGDGPLRSEILSSADQLGVSERVRLLGSRDDVPQLLPGADIWVLASESEGLPISVMEAMACGLPIVCYDLPTLREMLDDGAGVLVDHDPKALARAVDSLLDDPDRASLIGAAANRRATQKYDAALMADSIEAIYRSILSG